MFYIGKLAQAAGLTILLLAFIRHFPGLMGYRELAVGSLLFLSGWIIDRFLLRK